MTEKEIAAIERAAAHENCGCVPDRIHALIGGALFDFLGYLTSRDERITLSARDLASPAADALTKWAEKYGLCLNVADVSGWDQSLAAAPAAPTEGACKSNAISGPMGNGLCAHGMAMSDHCDACADDHAAHPDPLLAECVEALEKLTDNAEQYAFEVWLRTATPSGDAESVKRQWEESSDFSDFADEWASALGILAKVQAAKEGK